MTNILRGFSWLVIGGFVVLAATALPASAAKNKICGDLGGSRFPCVHKKNCTCYSLLALDGMCYFSSCKKELTCAQMDGSLKPCSSKAGCDCTSTKASDGICFFESCRPCPDVPGPFCIDTVVDYSAGRYTDALAVDPQNLLLYYNDEFHSAVFQHDLLLNKSTLFAGNKKIGCSGDGGPATSARLGGSGMTVSPGFNVPSWGQFGQGYLFIADTANHRIRVIAPGPRGASGDIASLDTDPLQASCAGQNTPWNQDPPLGPLTYKGPPGRLALVGLTSDGQGNLIGTNSDGQIYKITLPDQNVSVIAGQPWGQGPASGVPGPASKAILFEPRSPIIDKDTGALFFIERGRNRIDKLDAAGNISIVAGSANGTGGPPDPDGTPPAQAHFLYPNGMAMDSAGNIYVADTSNSVIRVIDQRANEVCTIAGTGGFWSDSTIGEPSCVAVYEPQSGGRTGLPRIFLSDESYTPPSKNPVSSAVRVIFPCSKK